MDEVTMDEAAMVRIVEAWKRGTPQPDALRMAFDDMQTVCKRQQERSKRDDDAGWSGPEMNALARQASALAYAACLSPAHPPYFGPNDHTPGPSRVKIEAVEDAVKHLGACSARLLEEIAVSEEAAISEESFGRIAANARLRSAAGTALAGALSGLRCGMPIPRYDGPGETSDPGAPPTEVVVPPVPRLPVAICTLNDIPAGTMTRSATPLFCALADDGSLWCAVVDNDANAWIRMPDLPPHAATDGHRDLSFEVVGVVAKAEGAAK